MGFQRWIQTFCLAVFLGLLVLASGELVSPQTLDFFLRLDPSIAVITSISSRSLIMRLFPAVALVALTLFLGRFFCGHICPMGTTLDLADNLFGVPYKKQKKPASLRPVKYMVLVAVVAASIPGISYVFFASPLSLITRFYGLIILPIVKLFAATGHRALFPLWEALDINALLFLQIQVPRYATQFFILVFFAGLFCLSRITPRFWCRYICPAGAVFALFSKKPLVRRMVSDSCTDCGKCVRACSMGAIDDSNPFQTRFEECVVCLSCEKICPEAAITFSREKNVDQPPPGLALPTRRQFIVTGVAGAGTALVSLTGLNTSLGKNGEGQVAPAFLIRPPATLPESEFLSRCIRCGECMVACPTNTLQPLWFEAGLTGLFSPAMLLRRGYCDPDCHRCAEVCPTESIRKISITERPWAKTGTAVIHREKCLAWEQDQKCMVCDEVCPFGAIQFSRETGLAVTVPKVREDRCTGCGYCEFNCPVQNRPAIIVSPMNALRLEQGSFKSAGVKAGLNISREEKKEKGYPGSEGQDQSTPGFDSGSPPGFSPD